MNRPASSATDRSLPRRIDSPTDSAGAPSTNIRTPLCERLGIELPIFSAGMGPISGPRLAAAVSNAALMQNGAGNIAGLIEKVVPAAEVVHSMADEARALLRGWSWPS